MENPYCGRVEDSSGSIKVHVVGGTTTAGFPHNKVKIYDVDTDAWAIPELDVPFPATSHMGAAVSYETAAAGVTSYVMIPGKDFSGPYDRVFCYNVGAGGYFDTTATLPTPRFNVDAFRIPSAFVTC